MKNCLLLLEGRLHDISSQSGPLSLVSIIKYGGSDMEKLFGDYWGINYYVITYISLSWYKSQADFIAYDMMTPHTRYQEDCKQ